MSELIIDLLRDELRILNEMDNILSAPEKWTKGAVARDAEGHLVSLRHRRDKAVCFCLIGSLNSAYLTVTDGYSEQFASAKIRVTQRLNCAVQIRGFHRVADFNDSKATKFEDVREVLGTVRVATAREIAELRAPIFKEDDHE